MMKMRPPRLTTLHFLQIGLTDARTFMIVLNYWLSQTSDDATTS